MDHQPSLVTGSLLASRTATEYQRLLAMPSLTDRDIGNHENKIEANLIFAGDYLSAKTELLKCNAADIDYLIMIRSKDDYLRSYSKLAARTVFS